MFGGPERMVDFSSTIVGALNQLEVLVLVMIGLLIWIAIELTALNDKFKKKK